MTIFTDEQGEEVPDEFAELNAMLAGSLRNARDPLDPALVAARKRLRRRRLTATLTVTAVIVAAVGIYVPVTLLTPVATISATITNPEIVSPEAVVLAVPSAAASAVNVTGAEGFDGTVGTEGILASSGGTEPRPIASISKIITALVVLDAKPLAADDAGPTIRFSKADSKLYDKYYVMGATTQPMRSGSSMSQHDALEIMLVLSASKLALANPVIADIVKMPFTEVSNFHGQVNTNVVVGFDGINGVKTGTLEKYGSNLLFSAAVGVPNAPPISIVGIVLGGPDQYAVGNSARELIRSIVAGFHEVPLVVEGQSLGSYTTAWGAEAKIVAGETASILTWSDAPIAATAEAKPLATGADGSNVGSVTFVAGNETVTVPLELDGGIQEPDAWWRLTHPGELLG